MKGLVGIPYEYYPDTLKGRPVFNGSIFIGKPNLDPEIEANQKDVFVSAKGVADGTELQVSQPILTNAGGVPVDNGSPVSIFVEGEFSIKVLNSKGTQVFYIPIFSGDLTRSDLINLNSTFDTFALMLASTDDTLVRPGSWITVKGNTVPGDGGYAEYFVKTASQAAADGDAINGIRNATLATGDVAILQTELFGTVANPARDVRPIFNGVSSVANTPNKVMIEKLRTDFPEFAVYTPLSPDGRDWHRWLFTNRFNIDNGSAPRMINCSLAGLYPATENARVAANNVSETTGSATTVTKASSDGVQVGTWVGPAIVLTTTDVLYSSTVGDTLTYTITGVERLHLRGLYAGNGGIGLITITESAVEIPEANYLLPADHLVNFISTATGNTTMHLPLADGLDTAKTYVVEIKVDASNPVGNRVYQAGLLGYDDIAYNAVGMHGIVLDASLADQTNSMSVTPGTTAVYQFDDATRVDWRYVETNVASIAQFTVYDSVGTEISTYENQSVDMYAVGSTARKITVAKDLAKGTYYLHVQNGKTRNASSTDYRYYDFGGLGYDETQAGTIGVDDFDDKDMPKIIQDPNNDSGEGTEYMLIGSGNLELAIDVEKPGSGVNEFVGGIHGFETTPVPVFKVDDAVIDFAGAAQFDTFIGSDVEVTFTTTLLFPSDSSNFCTAEYTYFLSQYGYTVRTKKTTLADALIRDDFSLMLNCPNTDTSQGVAQTQGLSVGGGFKHVMADTNYVLDSFDNAGTFVQPKQESVAFVNGEFTALCSYVHEIQNDNTIIPPFASSNNWSLAQDRTDRTVKFYTRAYPGDDQDGITVPAGTTVEHSKNYRVIKGNYLGALK